MQASCLLGSNGQQLLTSGIHSASIHSKTPPMAHSAYGLPCSYSTCRTNSGCTQYTQASSTCYFKTSASTNDDLMTIQKVETDLDDHQMKTEPVNDQVLPRQPPSAHRSPVADRPKDSLTNYHAISSPTSIFAAPVQTNPLFSFSNFSFPSATLGSQAMYRDLSADKSRQTNVMFASTGVLCVSRGQQPQQQTAPQISHSCHHYPDNFSMDQGQLGIIIYLAFINKSI